MIYVDNVSNLPVSKMCPAKSLMVQIWNVFFKSSRQDLEPSPFIEFNLGQEVQKTFPRPKTRNPLYRQKFIFYVTNVEQQNLKIEVSFLNIHH